MLIPQFMIFHKFMLSFTFNICLYHYCFTANVGGFVAVPLPTLSWYGGQTYCRTYHTDLASADTLTDINQIQQLTAQQGTSWFGLFRDVWMWSDGTIPMGLKWGPGLPNNIDHDDNCGSVNNSLLMDRQCDNLFNFFCHTRESFVFWVTLWEP